MKCEICHGEGWVCEDHEDKAWKSGYGCCGGAGVLCICKEDVALAKMAEEAGSDSERDFFEAMKRGDS